MAPNRIKRSGGGLALQITQPARAAGLVTETADGDLRETADVFVVAVDDTILVGNRDTVTGRERVELITPLARDAESLHRIVYTRIQPEGHGYQVQLPNAADAGFATGDRAPVVAGDDILIIHDGDTSRANRAASIATIRETK